MVCHEYITCKHGWKHLPLEVGVGVEKKWFHVSGVGVIGKRYVAEMINFKI